MRWSSLLLVVLAACTPALDASQAVFRCASDDDCDGNTKCIGPDGDKQCISQDADCRTAGSPAPDGTECADDDGVDGPGVCVLGRCKPAVCGDGFVTRGAGEECEAVGLNANPFCNGAAAADVACRFPVCGNGLRERGEACETGDPDCVACVTVCDGGVDAVDVDADPSNGCEGAGTVAVDALPLGTVNAILGVSGSRVYVSLGPQSPEDVGFFDVAANASGSIALGVGGVVLGRGSTDDGGVLVLSLNSAGPAPSDNILKRIDPAGDSITDVANLGTAIPLAVAQRNGRTFVAAQGSPPTLHEVSSGALVDLAIAGCDEPVDLLVCGAHLVCLSGTPADGSNFDAFSRSVLLVDDNDVAVGAGSAAVVGCVDGKVWIDDRNNVMELNDDGTVAALKAVAPATLSLRRLQDAVRPTLIGEEVLLHSGPAFDGPTLVRLDDGAARVIASDDPNGNGGLRATVVVQGVLYTLSDTNVRRVAP